MCFDRNINGNRDVKFLECDYLLVQRCVKLTLGQLRDEIGAIFGPLGLFACFMHSHSSIDTVNNGIYTIT